MTNIEELAKWRQRLMIDVLSFFKEYNIKYIEFNTMFSCLIYSEYGGNDLYLDHIAKRMWDNGVIEGTDIGLEEDTTWDLTDLSIVEIGHILDQLNAIEYKILDPEKDWS